MPGNTLRKKWMSLLAKSPPDALQKVYSKIEVPTDFQWLRHPETGAVMVRGRMGGTGAPFNMGEMTVTRCSLRLSNGEVGHGYVQGRNKAHAKRAAIVDALMQSDKADVVGQTVIESLRLQAQVTKAAVQERADKTKVDFFTLVRGED